MPDLYRRPGITLDTSRPPVPTATPPTSPATPPSRSEVVCLRVTPAERDLLAALADVHGTDRSTLIRDLVSRAPLYSVRWHEPPPPPAVERVRADRAAGVVMLGSEPLTPDEARRLAMRLIEAAGTWEDR